MLGWPLPRWNLQNNLLPVSGVRPAPPGDGSLKRRASRRAISLRVTSSSILMRTPYEWANYASQDMIKCLQLLKPCFYLQPAHGFQYPRLDKHGCTTYLAWRKYRRCWIPVKVLTEINLPGASRRKREQLHMLLRHRPPTNRPPIRLYPG